MVPFPHRTSVFWMEGVQQIIENSDRKRASIGVFQRSLWKPLLGGFGPRFWKPKWGLERVQDKKKSVQKLITKNDQNFEEKSEFLCIPKIVHQSIFTSNIINLGWKSEVFKTHSSRSRASVGGALRDTGAFESFMIAFLTNARGTKGILTEKGRVLRTPLPWIDQGSATSTTS